MKRIKFTLEESTVASLLMHNSDKEIEMQVGCGFEWLNRRTSKTNVWYFEPAFNDLRSAKTIINRFKRAFRENKIKCLNVKVVY